MQMLPMQPKLNNWIDINTRKKMNKISIQLNFNVSSYFTKIRILVS
jgi:hypothetical protein